MSLRLLNLNMNRHRTGGHRTRSLTRYSRLIKLEIGGFSSVNVNAS